MGSLLAGDCLYQRIQSEVPFNDLIAFNILMELLIAELIG
jgi:hypothetical protein